MTDRLVVLSTVGSQADAERIARAVVERRLAACVNVLPGVTSFYRWKGELAKDGEWLLVMKTRAERFEALRAAVLELHAYETPELIALPIADGDPAYLRWLDEQVPAEPAGEDAEKQGADAG